MRPTTEAERRKPTQERSRHLVDSILEGAGRLLLGSPAEHITIARIAQIAGVSVGSLYQYFQNKESVLQGVIERALRADVERVDAVIERERGRPLGDLIRGIVEATVLARRRDRVAHARILLLVPVLGRFAAVRRVVREMRAVARGKLEEHAGAVRDGDLDLMTFVFTAAVENVVNAAVLERPDLLDHPRFVDEVTLLATRYLARAPAPG